MKLQSLLGPALILGLVAFIGWRTLRPPAPTPAVFQDGSATLTLTGALERSKTEGKPVFAFATADWCGPCQSLKRGALADERVKSFLEDNLIPVYVDVDKNPADASMLGVSSLPVSFVILDGQITSKTMGDQSATKYLAWLESAVDPGG